MSVEELDVRGLYGEGRLFDELGLGSVTDSQWRSLPYNENCRNELYQRIEEETGYRKEQVYEYVDAYIQRARWIFYDLSGKDREKPYVELYKLYAHVATPLILLTSTNLWKYQTELHLTANERNPSEELVDLDGLLKRDDIMLPKILRNDIVGLDDDYQVKHESLRGTYLYHKLMGRGILTPQEFDGLMITYRNKTARFLPNGLSVYQKFHHKDHISVYDYIDNPRGLDTDTLYRGFYVNYVRHICDEKKVESLNIEDVHKPNKDNKESA